MTAPIAGWYADPAGDATKLRYWDGTKWTDSCMDAAAAQTAPVGQPTQPVAQPTAQPVEQPTQPTQPVQPTQPTQPVQPTQPQSAAIPQPDYTQGYVNYADMPLYYVSPQDSTLRLVAFILALLSTISYSWCIVTLAWMIPMTVMTWGIYKGKRPNTVAFGVCSLLFLFFPGFVSGILLLVSNKDE